MYVRAVRDLRLRELQNVECMSAVRAGLGSIIPLQLLTLLSPAEMELRTCGLPNVNLEFLKVKHSRSFTKNPQTLFLKHSLDTQTLVVVVGSHHVSGGSDGDGSAHRVLLGGSGNVHSGGAQQVHKVRLQPGAHSLHLSLQRRRSGHRSRASLPHEDRPA